MLHVTDFIIPGIIAFVMLYGVLSGVDIFGSFLEGAKEGMSTCAGIFPAIVALITAISMLTASGAIDVLTYALRPFANLLMLPAEVVPLALLRPISGSGGLVIFQELLRQYGPDSHIGRVASVMQGSTETTFYTIAVYYGAVGVRNIRHTLPAALSADLAGFIMSAAVVAWLMPPA